jgi:hypothetical protein
MKFQNNNLILPYKFICEIVIKCRIEKNIFFKEREKNIDKITLRRVKGKIGE